MSGRPRSWRRGSRRYNPAMTTQLVQQTRTFSLLACADHDEFNDSIRVSR